jgi:hypothetical protein
MLNPKLNPGDRVRLVYMSGEMLTPGTWGTVKRAYELFGDDQYDVTWDDGNKENIGKTISTLSLISGEDAWTTTDKKR